jgi:hypothetical protein
MTKLGGCFGEFSAHSIVVRKPKRFVIPDKRSADPEPMPEAAMKQERCRIWRHMWRVVLRLTCCTAADGMGSGFGCAAPE